MSHDRGHPRRMDGTESTPPPLGPRAWREEPGDARTPGMWDRKSNVDRLLLVFYLVCAVVVVLDLVIDREVHHDWENLFSFYALYGFASFWLLVATAKRLRRFLMRPEDYYEADRDGGMRRDAEAQDVD